MKDFNLSQYDVQKLDSIEKMNLNGGSILGDIFDLIKGEIDGAEWASKHLSVPPVDHPF